jgi:hypothetical protein
MSTLRAVDLIKTAATNISGLSFITGTRLLNNIEADNITLPVCILDRPIRIPVEVAAGGRMIEQFECTVFFFDKSELEYQFELHEPIIGAMKLNADQFIVNLNSFSDFILNIEGVVYTDLINALDSNLTGVQVTFTLNLLPESEQVCPVGTFVPEGLPPFTKFLTDAPSDGNQYVRQNADWEIVQGGSSALLIEDEGNEVTPTTTTINFTGVGVTASLTSPGVVEVNIPGSGAEVGTLQEVSDIGNTTTNDIQLIDDADYILGSGGTLRLDNGARLQEGTNDAQLGASKGIALRCSIDYELKWEAGRLFVMEQDGFIIREVRYTRFLTPTVNDDVTIGFVDGSRWVLDNGDVYVCTDPTEDAAVWVLQSGEFTPTISSETDCTANSFRALYSRVGKIVTCSYYLDVTMDAGITLGTFNLSLPVNTTFVNPRDAFGVITPITDPYANLVSAITSADITTDQINITIQLASQGGSLAFVCNLQYIINNP